MRGKRIRYTFVIEFLGGTYVRQGLGESPELALRAWLCAADGEDIEWSAYRMELLEQLAEHPAVPVETCENVWCLSGTAGDHLYLVHIIGTESGPGAGRKLAVEQIEQIGSDARRRGWSDRK